MKTRQQNAGFLLRVGRRNRFHGAEKLVIDVIGAGHVMRIEAVVSVDVRHVVSRTIVRIEAQRFRFLRGVVRRVVALRLVVLVAFCGCAFFCNTETRRFDQTRRGSLRLIVPENLTAR